MGGRIKISIRLGICTPPRYLVSLDQNVEACKQFRAVKFPTSPLFAFFIENRSGQSSATVSNCPTQNAVKRRPPHPVLLRLLLISRCRKPFWRENAFSEK